MDTGNTDSINNLHQLLITDTTVRKSGNVWKYVRYCWKFMTMYVLSTTFVTVRDTTYALLGFKKQQQLIHIHEIRRTCISAISTNPHWAIVPFTNQCRKHSLDLILSSTPTNSWGKGHHSLLHRHSDVSTQMKIKPNKQILQFITELN